MLRNVCRNGILLFKDSRVLSTNVLTPSSRIVFKRAASNGAQSSSVADDAKAGAEQQKPDDNRPPSVKVLYDGECNICMQEVRMLRSLVQKKPVEFIDINSPKYVPEDFHNVTYEMAMKEMHVIGIDGTVYVQGDAIREMYRAVGLGWLVAATRVPGIKQACDMLYVKFTHYRLENALNRCDSGDSCSIKLKHLRDKLRRPKQ